MSASARGIGPALVKLSVFTVVTVLLTAVLAGTIANANFGDQAHYKAMFSSASGLQEGDGVRISGVKVGEVTGVEPTDVDGESHAEVTFDVSDDKDLPAGVTATVRYKDLIGQRYLALGTDVERSGDKLEPGDRIPEKRTEHALDLTALFNGFQPLFQALDPKQVNKLSYEIIQVFQGEGGTINSLLAHTASLTSTIADKDEVIGKVIDNLNDVLGTVNDRGTEFGDLVDVTQDLVSGLSEQRKPIGEAVSALDDLTSTTAGFMSDAREPLHDDISALDDLSKNLLDSDDLLKNLLAVTPDNLRDYTNVLSYGSWYNYYACSVDLRFGVGEHYSDVPLVPLPGSHRAGRCQA